jgi:hypothetical protein
MPKKTTRHWAKRKLVSSRGNIDQCGQHIFAVARLYEEHHPEISNQLDMVLTILAEVDQEINIVESGI